jgi:molecular chaperone HtpG
MSRCADLLPDYFAFVKGIVDSEDLSLNISGDAAARQAASVHRRNLKTKIKNELESLLKNERSQYEIFFRDFGRQLKFGVYADSAPIRRCSRIFFVLLLEGEKTVTLEEYVSRMPEGQKYIYYAAGESAERIGKMPQLEILSDKGYEILYFTDDVDEFAVRMLSAYGEKEFKSALSGDLGLEEAEKAPDAEDQETGEILESMRKILEGRVKEVRASKRLKNHPVCLANEGELSIEMEKILKPCKAARISGPKGFLRSTSAMRCSAR